MLKESLANALHDPAMDLALEQERVDGAAEIVGDGVALDYDGAGIGVDLDLDDGAAVGEGLSWRHAVMRRIEPRLHARRQFRGVARRLRTDRTSTLESPANGLRRMQSGRSERQHRPASQLPHECRSAGRTMDATDTAAPETRYCGRSQRLVVQRGSPAQGTRISFTP